MPEISLNSRDYLQALRQQAEKEANRKDLSLRWKRAFFGNAP